MQRVINVAELAKPDWNFIEDHYQGHPVTWSYHSANPCNVLERLITRPKIGRYRACAAASLKLKSERDVVISHLPRTSHWQSVFMKKLGKENRHLAFSFNFTDLPDAKLRAKMTESFQTIDAFVVYSEYEKKLYSDFFSIPREKIDMLHWAAGEPVCDDTIVSQLPKNYYCSVGGEGRDYRTLIKAFAKMPNLQLVIVTRPHAIEGISLPSNVHLYCNLPSSQYWSVVANSRALLLPLRDQDTPCGHITLVGAMRLGKPIISSFSQGTTDYFKPGEGGLGFEAKNISALKQAVEAFEDDLSELDRYGDFNRAFARTHCDVKVWSRYVQGFIEAGLS
ncbi:glycosyltransferase [Teredinibacter waterburyi]|uniref:glycosyltransferase n=1 Tax=Teredinibacter waterburyi TaxID=1500538 RepID=UPI00165F612B|nr:glycosyltransferase [Teredinibacter waterburyi]